VASAVDARHSNASPAANSAKTPGPGSPPSPKLNSVAHEVAVTATGARPAESGGQRELFTEETTTVLVFENGGVLRLSAAVVPGQLLFLTNKTTRREVVAQVTRKRDFRPTSCYVEVEFSEPSPGFWGLEFPETPQLAPANAQQREAAELVQSAKVVPGKPSAPVPTTQEVTALKQEVKALREQLKLLQTQTAPANASAPTVTPDPPHAPAAARAQSEQSPNLPSSTSEVAASKPATAPVVSAALPTEPGGPSFSEEVVLPKPVVRVNRPKPKANRSPKPKESSSVSARPSALRVALLSAPLLLGAAGAAWFLNWIPWVPQPKIISAGAPPSIAVHPAPAASPAPPKTTDAHSNPASIAPPSNGSTTQPPADSKEAAQVAPKEETAPPTLAKPVPPATIADASVDPATAQMPELSTAAAKRSVRSSIKTASAAAAPRSPGAATVPPRLIKSVVAIASPNALQYFDRDKTATVTLDALVDATGRVKSTKALSGPASLRNSAIDALKQYRYEPARLRGQPVAAHVTVTIKFLFEP
jgi:protein TonB